MQDEPPYPGAILAPFAPRAGSHQPPLLPDSRVRPVLVVEPFVGHHLALLAPGTHGGRSVVQHLALLVPTSLHGGQIQLPHLPDVDQHGAQPLEPRGLPVGVVEPQVNHPRPIAGPYGGLVNPSEQRELPVGIVEPHVGQHRVISAQPPAPRELPVVIVEPQRVVPTPEPRIDHHRAELPVGVVEPQVDEHRAMPVPPHLQEESGQPAQEPPVLVVEPYVDQHRSESREPSDGAINPHVDQHMATTHGGQHTDPREPPVGVVNPYVDQRRTMSVLRVTQVQPHRLPDPREPSVGIVNPYVDEARAVHPREPPIAVVEPYIDQHREVPAPHSEVAQRLRPSDSHEPQVFVVRPWVG